MTQTTIGDLNIGDWFVVSHLPNKDIKQKRRYRSRYFANWSPLRFHKECVAELKEMNHLYGHTWQIRYICVCRRYFEERVKTGTSVIVLTREEAMMKKLTS